MTTRLRPMARQRETHRTLVTILTGLLASDSLDVVDLGGGTGGLAAELAGLGHRVTVVDPSPDALSAVRRRATEAGVADRLTGRQGDSSTLAQDLPAGSVDLVLCHHVIDVVDDPAGTVAAAATVLRPGGALSLLGQQRWARSVRYASAGDFTRAAAALTDPRLLDPERARALVAAAGFEVVASHGLGLVADRVPDEVAEGRSRAVRDLEGRFAVEPGLLAAAPRLHLFARRR